MKSTSKIYNTMPTNTDHDNGFKRLLRSIVLYSTDGSRPTVREIADLLRVSESSVYGYLAADKLTNMSYDQARALSRYLLIEYGDRRIIDWFDDPCSRARANGMIADEIMRMDVAQGALITACESHDVEEAKRRLTELEKELDNLKAEVSLMEAEQ